ncbi:MAG TPA: hypothetical protein VLB83_05670 [Candidatus Paceibacterota bacterium]|nr:hypothetical protein [Candidatus Paceibacterota bacterium]
MEITNNPIQAFVFGSILGFMFGLCLYAGVSEFRRLRKIIAAGYFSVTFLFFAMGALVFMQMQLVIALVLLAGTFTGLIVTAVFVNLIEKITLKHKQGQTEDKG